MAYSYYDSIAVQHGQVGSNETNFPVALVGTNSNFATTANGGSIENTDANGGASGSLTVPADFVVCTDQTDPAGTKLDFEFVDYNASTGYIELWVEIDALSSSSNTTIYFVYGDSGVTTSQENVTGTWGNGFEGVWHFGHGGSGTAPDSTNNNDLTDSASATGTTGKIGQGQEFDESSEDEYLVSSTGDYDNSGSFTISAWAYNVNRGTLRDRVVAAKMDGKGWILWADQGDDYWEFYTQDSSNFDYAKYSQGSLSNNVWYHLVGRASGSDIDIFVDGDLGDTSGAYYEITQTCDFTVGSTQYHINRHFNGYIDEVRFASAARDSDWIATSYNNQDDPAPNSTFWTAFGGEQPINNPPNAPTNLLCEGETNPSAVTDTTPEFSAIYDDDDTSDVATHAEVEVNTASDFTGTVMWDSGSIDITNVNEGNRCADISYNGSSLSWGTTYYWRIRFYDGDDWGDWGSAQFTMESVPSAPTNCTGVYSATDQSYCTWTDNSDNEDNFRVEYSINDGSWTFHENASANATQSSAYNVGADNKIEWRVRAENAAGDSAYSTSGAVYTTPSAPGTPSLTWESIGTEATITWTDNSTYEDGFELQRRTDDGAWANVDSSATSPYSDTGVSGDDHKYEWRVRAYTPTGDDGPQYSAWATSAGSLYSYCSDPTDLSASWVTRNESAEITWTDQSTYEDYFTIYRQLGATSPQQIDTAESSPYTDTAVPCSGEGTGYVWYVGTASPVQDDGTRVTRYSAGVYTNSLYCSSVESITGDAVVKKAVSDSLTADSIILGTISDSATADAVIKGSVSDSITADAIVGKTVSGSVTADSVVLSTVSDSITVDAVILGTVSESITAFSVILETLSGAISSDSIILSAQDSSVTTDAVILATIENSISADAVVEKSVEASITADAYITTGVIVGSFSADSVIRKSAGDSFSADSIIKALQEFDLSADAVLKSTAEFSFNSDAWVIDRLESTFTTDAWIVETTQTSITADAIIETSVESGLSADSIFIKTSQDSFTADALLVKRTQGSISVDSIIESTIETGVSADAILFKSTQESITADAIFRRSSEFSITSDSVITKSVLSSFTADAFVFKKEITLDAIIIKTLESSLTSDAYFVHRTTGSVVADAYFISRSITGTPEDRICTIESELRKRTISTETRVCTKKVETATCTVDAESRIYIVEAETRKATVYEDLTMTDCSYEKDPGSLLDYEIDWSDWLVDDDIILTSEWTVPAGLTKTDEEVSDTSTKIWLEGGSVGNLYTVINSIVTNEGRKADRSIFIHVKQR